MKYLTFKTEPPDHHQQKFLNLYEYINIAKKIISYKNIKHTDDLISDVVHAMILADWKYSARKGSRKTIRFNYAFKTLKPKPKKQMYFEQISQDKYIDQLNKQQVYELLKWSGLSMTESACLELYFLYNYTVIETGQKLGLTSYIVRKNMDVALHKLKRYV